MCENPIVAWLDNGSETKNGKHPVIFSLPQSSYDLIAASGDETCGGRYRSIILPCGKCFSCRRDRAWQLTVRASFEARLYDKSSFITLTVADSKLSEVFPHGVEHRPFQLFAKRLRKKIGPFRFLMCAEYGSQTLRPHYHAIIFGHDLVDPLVFPDGTYCPSKVLAECWSFGHVQCDVVNENRIAYVAGYTLKDYQLGRDKEWYDSRGLNLPYVRWSRRPGLGFGYFKKFWPTLVKHSDVWSESEHYDQYFTKAIFNRSERACSCRYFSDKLQLLSPSLYDKIQASKLDKPPVSIAAQMKRNDDIKRASATRQYALSLKSRDLMSHNVGIVN